MRILRSARTPVFTAHKQPAFFRPVWLFLSLAYFCGCHSESATERVSSGIPTGFSGGLLGGKSRAGRLAAPPAPSTPNLLMPSALPLEHSLELQPYLADLLDNFSFRRWERHVNAYEPREGTLDLVPNPNSTRARRAKDDIELHFRVGEELFDTELSVMAGFGDGLDGKKPPNMHRVHRGAHGGPDTSSCKSCHHRSGDDGAGEYTEAALTGGDGNDPYSAAERNPPALHGSGALQILAAQITRDLQTQANSSPANVPRTIDLKSDDTSFGKIIVFPDGRIDASKLVAIDRDIIVRPFGWKGTHSTLRRFAEEAFQVHHGLQSSALLMQRRIFGPAPRDTSPATRAVLAMLGDGPVDNPDRDDGSNEIMSSQLTAMAVYLTLLPLPVIEPPRSRDLYEAWREGAATFSEIGCQSCHKPMWIIKDPTWNERSEDESGRANLLLDLRKDIRNGPQLRNTNIEVDGYPIFPFTDMRRHDMGEELADKPPSPSRKPTPGDAVGPSIPRSYFFTRALWGLSDSGPYLHDGRAMTIHDAIIAHGGEAAAVRDNYKQLSPERQRALQIFLFSLARPTLPEVTP